MIMFSKNSHCDLDLGPGTLKLEIIKYIVILNICMILNQSQSLNEGVRAMTMFFFLKIASVTLTLALNPSNSKVFKILSYFIFV